MKEKMLIDREKSMESNEKERKYRKKLRECKKYILGE